MQSIRKLLAVPSDRSDQMACSRLSCMLRRVACYTACCLSVVATVVFWAVGLAKLPGSNTQQLLPSDIYIYSAVGILTLSYIGLVIYATKSMYRGGAVAAVSILATYFCVIRLDNYLGEPGLLLSVFLCIWTLPILTALIFDWLSPDHDTLH